MGHVDVLLIWYLAVFGLFVPYVAIKSARNVRAGAAVPRRSIVFLNTIVMEGLFLVVALFAARMRHIDLLAPGSYSALSIVTAAVILVLCLATVRLRFSVLSDEERRRTMLSRPRVAGDLKLWLLVSLAAGVVEEIVYRGVMYQMLVPAVGVWPAVGLCVAVFVAGHGGRNWQRMTIIGFVACACHLLVWMTGSLFLAMTVHFLYDFIAGIMYIGLARSLPDPHETGAALTPAA